MSTATIAAIGASRMMTTWIKLGLGIVAVAVGWWGLSLFEYERYLSPIVLMQWLNDAGPWGPLILIGSMVCAVGMNSSLKTFALATLFGMAPPAFAFTYLGSRVVSAQWSLIGQEQPWSCFFWRCRKF